MSLLCVACRLLVDGVCCVVFVVGVYCRLVPICVAVRCCLLLSVVVLLLLFAFVGNVHYCLLFLMLFVSVRCCRCPLLWLSLLDVC